MPSTHITSGEESDDWALVLGLHLQGEYPLHSGQETNEDNRFSCTCLARQDAGAAVGLFQPFPEILILDMDRAGVDQAIIVPVAYLPYGLSPGPAWLDNEFILHAVRKYPNRLDGLVEVDPHDHSSANTVKRYLNEGMSRLKLLPARHCYLMSDHFLLDPLLKICAQVHAFVFVRATDDISNTPLQIEEMARTFLEIPAFVIGQLGRK